MLNHESDLNKMKQLSAEELYAKKEWNHNYAAFTEHYIQCASAHQRALRPDTRTC